VAEHQRRLNDLVLRIERWRLAWQVKDWELKVILQRLADEVEGR
jgi:hypothetical protein